MDENMNLTPENNEKPENAPELVTPAEPETLDSPEIEVVSETEAASEPEPIDTPEIEIVPEPETVSESQPEPIVSAPQNTSGGYEGAANQTTPPPQNATYIQNIIQKPEEGSTVLAVVSLVLGILGILIGCCLACAAIPGGLIFSIPATICSIISIFKRQGGRGMAIAGLIMGIIGDVLGIVLLLALVGIFGNMMLVSDMQDYMA